MTLLSKESEHSLFHITKPTVHHGEIGLYCRMALRFGDLVSAGPAEPLRHRVALELSLAIGRLDEANRLSRRRCPGPSSWGSRT